MKNTSAEGTSIFQRVLNYLFSNNKYEGLSIPHIYVTPPQLKRSNQDYIGESRKSHLEIRSSYGSRDSLFDFWEKVLDFDPGFPKQNPSGFFGRRYNHVGQKIPHD